MHIHRLGFGALGPFAGEHVIDFDGLGGSTVFLIDGPTGAGKSTIIDAIVFALFGDVSGSGSDRQRLRSSFARPTDESYAELDFSTSFGRYRVRRTPEYERAKVRGTGTTRAPSSVVLLRSTGPEGWESVSTRQGEADSEIARLVGLSRAQFLQTVVLPQGEFATFLVAESKDRQAVLERIFATGLYSRIEAALEEARRQAQAARDAAEQEVERSINHVRSRLSDAELEDSLLDVRADAGVEEVLAALGALVEGVAARLAVQTGLVNAKAHELAVVTARLAARRALTAAQERLDLARQSLARARIQEAEARAALGEHWAALTSVGGHTMESGVLAAAVDRVMGSLGAALEAEQRMAVDSDALAATQIELERVDARLAELQAERERGLPARLLALSSALQAAVSSAAEAAAVAAAREATLVRSRLEGMAAELAAQLVDGQPCPVCGADHHPSPAAQAGGAVTADDLAAAAQARSAADSRRHAWELEQARLESAASELGPADSAAQPAAAMELADLAAQVRGLHLRITQIDAGIETARDERSSISAAIAHLSGGIAERRLVVEAGLAGYPSVATRVAEMAALRQAVDRLEAAGKAVAARELAAAAMEAEHADLLSAMTAARDDAVGDDAVQRQHEELSAEVRTATSERDGTASLLEDLATRVRSARRSVDSRDQCSARTADVISLANVVKGGVGNAMSQPLSAYVVQTMFDEVLASANRRLRTMLDGRFELQSTEERTGRKLIGLGLGLEILDLRTDSVRRTATLSGGETFCASLALALGLADTVRAHAGGVEIGMLLIDEGFGSLDGDRLDEVMAELLRLRADGRTVGVISHVTEMKGSIRERIDVRPLGARLGSTLDISWSD